MEFQKYALKKINEARGYTWRKNMWQFTYYTHKALFEPICGYNMFINEVILLKQLLLPFLLELENLIKKK